MANKLTIDFPRRVYDDIEDGIFTRRMQHYQRQRNEPESEDFADFGEITDQMDFEEMVRLYEKICEHDEKQGRTWQM